jgi:hypothetical protein
VLVLIVVSILAGCAWIRYEDIQDGDLTGKVLVEWYQEDGFIYRRQKNKPLRFKPSFMADYIEPKDMYTTGGSVPRIFWSIPGLSPWGLGPAYIIHDWIFEVHRCKRADALPHERNINFEDSARILAEVGKELIEAKLIQHNVLEAIVWAVNTQYARDLWERPATPEECAIPKPAYAVRDARGRVIRPTIVTDFVVPSRRR